MALFCLRKLSRERLQGAHSSRAQTTTERRRFYPPILGQSRAFLSPLNMACCCSDSRMSFQIRAAVAPAIKPLAEATRLEIDAGLRKGDYACISCSLAAIS
jgi:hypothetical protein